MGHQRWGSAATVSFHGKGPKGVGFQLIVWSSQPLSRQLAIRGDGRANNTTIFAVQGNQESDTPFTLTLDKGVVTVSSAGRVVTSVHPQTDMDRVHLSCSGAHVRFLNVVVTALP